MITSPADLVSAIVGNNPTLVHQNLMNMGVVDQQFVMTPQSFTELLSSLPHEVIPDQQHAANFIASALNVPINNNGVAAGKLQTILNQYNLPIKDVVYNVFENNMPASSPDQVAKNSSGCSCGGACGQKMRGMQSTVLALALLGFLFVLILLVKLILKII